MGGIIARCGEIKDIEPCPVYGGEAHGAGFAAGIDFAACEREGIKICAGIANGFDFRMGGRIVGRGDAVPSAPDNFTAFDYHGAEWAEKYPEWSLV